MATIKSYTDIAQSKKLAEILPIESADMYYDGYGRFPKVYAYALISINSFECNVPCWSLAALLEQLNMPTLFRDFDGWTISCLSPSSHMPMIKSGFASPIEACVVMLKMIHDVDEQSQKAYRKDECEESRVKGNRYYENGDILPHAI